MNNAKATETKEVKEEVKPTPQIKDVLLVGIDLGTSRCAISADNGNKDWIESYVGWPKDFIAQKLLGKSVLFGADAIKHRLSLDMFRPLKDGVIKEGSTRDEEAVKELIKHLIGLASNNNEYKKVRAVVGVPARSFTASKIAVQKAVSGFVDALMVVSEPFSVAYGVDALDNAMIIDIGAGTLDFCIMHGTVPGEDEQRTVLTAGDYIDQQLHDFMKEKYPKADFNLNMVRRFKEENSFVGEPKSKVEVEVPIGGKPTMIDITEEMRKACESIMPPLLETCLELIAKYDPEYQDIVRQNIILAGGGSQIKGLAEYIAKALKEYGPTKAQVINEQVFGGADGALALAKDTPQEYWTDLK